MKPTLLLAATDPNSIYLLRRYAEESGFAIVHASEGKKVLALARQAKPTAIILEAGLPGMMGWSVLEGLRAEQATCRMPVVIYSWSDEEIGDQLEGTVGFLQHPVLYEDFLAALADAGVHPPDLAGDDTFTDMQEP